MATTNNTHQPPTSNPSPFLSTLHAELRLEIYKYLLDIHLQPQPFLGRITTHYSINPPQALLNHNEPQPPLLNPSILSNCRQIYLEALPILYTRNIFLANESSLASPPCLWIPPIKSPHPHPSKPITTSQQNISLIRRWRIRVRLDCGSPPWTAEEVMAAFSSAEELVIHPYRSIFIGGIGVDMLRRFESVRGVRRARILGSMPGFEGYAQWLEGIMMKPLGTETENGSYEKGVDVASRCEYQYRWELQRNGEQLPPSAEGKKQTVIMLGGCQCVDELERKRLTGWSC